MTSYKIACMETFTERLIWAMKCAGYDPAKDQSRIAALIGKPCKPQNIQHLLNPDNEVEHSKYTLDLAEVLGCDPFWLGRNKGVTPTLIVTDEAHQSPPGNYKYPAHENKVAPFVAMTATPLTQWPFKSFTLEEFNALDETLRQSYESIIFASIGNRGHPEKQATPAPTTTATDKAA